MSRKITIPARIARVGTLGTDGISFTIQSTREVSDVDVAVLLGFRKKEGWFLFSENELQEIDIPKKDAEIESKTPSQRLRAVLFIQWKQSGSKNTFEDYYRAKIEEYINEVKETLDD